MKGLNGEKLKIAFKMKFEHVGSGGRPFSNMAAMKTSEANVVYAVRLTIWLSRPVDSTAKLGVGISSNGPLVPKTVGRQVFRALIRR